MFNPAHDLYNELMKVNDSESINLSASFNSDARRLWQTPGYSIQFIWSGASTPVGIFFLQASNDGTNYTTIDESILAVTGASGSHMINVERPAYQWVRACYTRTSGSGGAVTIIIQGVS